MTAIKPTIEAVRQQLAADDQPVYLRPFALGVTAGMRSMMPFAVLSMTAAASKGTPGGVPSVLALPAVRWATRLAAVGELIGDKLPFAPSRLSPPALGARYVLGTLAGYTLARRIDGLSPLLGAASGAAGVTVGAFGGSALRARLGRETNLPDRVWATTEDSVAIALAVFATTGVPQTVPLPSLDPAVR